MSDDYSVLGSTETNKIYNAKIIVVGVGGGGCNTIQHMIDNNLKNVEFIAVNTDANSLTRSTSDIKVQIGVKLTSGLGSGCDPNKGRKAAEESAEDIKKLLQEGTLDELLDCLDFAPEGVTDLVKVIAVELPLNDVAKRDAILEKLHFNVTNAIKIKKETELPTEKTEAPKRRTVVKKTEDEDKKVRRVVKSE